MDRLRVGICTKSSEEKGLVFRMRFLLATKTLLFIDFLIFLWGGTVKLNKQITIWLKPILIFSSLLQLKLEAIHGGYTWRYSWSKSWEQITKAIQIYK